ncbi:hypothetical protein CR513_27124, partial [Mucuna pruriens]
MAVALSSCTWLSSVVFSTVKFRYSVRQRTIIHCNHKSNRQKEGVAHKKQSKDSRGNVLEPQPTSSKAFGIQKKNKEPMFDSKDQQVEPSDLQDSAFLNAVVKVKVKKRGDDSKYVAK